MKDTEVLVWYVKFKEQEPEKVKRFYDFWSDHVVILYTDIQETTMIYSEDSEIEKDLKSYIEKAFPKLVPQPMSKFNLPHTEPKVVVTPLETEIH